jgi:hypothetical protein
VRRSGLDRVDDCSATETFFRKLCCEAGRKLSKGWNFGHRSPPGTSQAAIDQQLTAHFLWHYGVTERLELNAALPITLSQNGAGLTPITAGASLPQVALRDARIGVGFALIRREERNALPSGVPFLPSQGSVSNGLGVGL